MNATTIWIDDTEYEIDKLIKTFNTDKLAAIIRHIRTMCIINSTIKPKEPTLIMVDDYIKTLNWQKKKETK